MTMFMLIGGIGTLLGPLVGGIIVPWLTQYMQFLQEYRFVVFGPILILLVIFVPYGIVGSYLARKAKRAQATRNPVALRPTFPDASSAAAIAAATGHGTGSVGLSSRPVESDDADDAATDAGRAGLG